MRFDRGGKLELTKAPRLKTVAAEIPEGFHSVEPERVAPRSEIAKGWLLKYLHAVNLFFSNSFTFPGFAFPPLPFITCPTRKPNT